MEDKLREEVTRLHAQVCSGLADPNRIMILYSLHDQDRNVGEMAELLDLPQPTISRHLKILRESGLVLSKREGRSIYYQLSDGRKTLAGHGGCGAIPAGCRPFVASIGRNRNGPPPDDLPSCRLAPSKRAWCRNRANGRVLGATAGR